MIFSGTPNKKSFLRNFVLSLSYRLHYDYTFIKKGRQGVGTPLFNGFIGIDSSDMTETGKTLCDSGFPPFLLADFSIDEKGQWLFR
jgi:hypothetical protein